ncbi:hypothetical protein BV22DRAFT_1066935 [Leucogyrophana mollusca]|uniref:Uncharacterized protein n=1 Tax=Leucogyrophana mollusca TaxID=85980 RepID=A0ACB8BEZ7_9AGAM|nr:hypothetical protein BV22DRAFT_1066935 [Leucogyrophana mollusca]
MLLHDRPTTIARDACSSAPPRHPKKNINALPNELLLIIFNIVYQLHRNAIGWSTADMLCPALFPFSVASVCRSWQDIMSMAPVFWTRLVILVDSQPTPLSLVKSYLEWSRDLPLHIFVTRRRTDQDEDDPHEKARVEAVMPLVLPHLHRLTGLCINVMRRSSLPSLREEFSGDAPNLKILKLSCEFDDDVDIFDFEDVDWEWYFSAPMLKRITLDGCNFRDVCTGDSRWHNLNQCVLEELVISHYTPAALDKALCLNDIFETIDSITQSPTSLVLKDLIIQLDEHAVIDFDFDTGLESMTLESLQGNAIGRILAAGFAPDVTITRCPPDCIRLGSTTCSLQDISAECDLQGTLRYWEGTYLEVDKCPSFDDKLLVAMADGGPHNQEFMCRALTYLCITNCSVSPAALKDMVEMRRDASKKEIQWEDISDTDAMTFLTVAPIHTLYVDGGGLLSQEDRRWFKNNLSSFFWSTTFEEDPPDIALDPNTYCYRDDT